MLSRLQEYPYPSKYPTNLIPDKISRYNDFCKKFVETCKQEDISGHAWLVSKEEGCMTHYLKNINFKDREECLRRADVVLYAQMYKNPDIVPEEMAYKMMEGLKQVNTTNPKFVMFSPFVDKNSSKDGCYVFKIQECPYWDMANWQKSNEKETPDPEYDYLKGWHVNAQDIELIELVLDAVRV